MSRIVDAEAGVLVLAEEDGETRAKPYSWALFACAVLRESHLAAPSRSV